MIDAVSLRHIDRMLRAFCTVQLLLFALALSHAGAGELPNTEETWKALRTHKALAVAPDAKRPVREASASMPSRLAAAQRALVSCEEKRRERKLIPPCEIRRIDAQRLDSAADLRRKAHADDATTPIMLWRSMDGATTLIGSMHVFRASLLPLPLPMLQAIEQADDISFEVDLNAIDSARMQRLIADHAMLPDDTDLYRTLGPAAYSRLERYLAPLANAGQFQRYKPAFIATNLMIGEFSSLGYLPSLGMDMLLNREVMRLGKPVLGLE